MTQRLLLASKLFRLQTECSSKIRLHAEKGTFGLSCVGEIHFREVLASDQCTEAFYSVEASIHFWPQWRQRLWTSQRLVHEYVTDSFMICWMSHWLIHELLTRSWMSHWPKWTVHEWISQSLRKIWMSRSFEWVSHDSITSLLTTQN